MKMYLETFLLIIAVIVLIYIFFSLAGIVLSPSQQPLIKEICFKDKCFQVELAQTQAQRDRGLMSRKFLDKDKGMLFIFEKEGVYSFWMKDTLIPLDIIWINSNKEVVFIKENAEPCKSLICPQIIPARLAEYVLELNAGSVKEIGLRVGDVLTGQFVVK